MSATKQKLDEAIDLVSQAPGYHVITEDNLDEGTLEETAAEYCVSVPDLLQRAVAVGVTAMSQCASVRAAEEARGRLAAEKAYREKQAEGDRIGALPAAGDGAMTLDPPRPAVLGRGVLGGPDLGE